MRANHQKSNFKPFRLPSRRPNTSSHSSPSSSNRAGIIERRLIEGSQQPCYSPSPQKSFDEIASFAHHENELDAFDLELLASENQEDLLQDSGLELSRSTPIQVSRQSDPQPPRFSRFFDPSLSITPYRGAASGSSDPISGLPSSPLALFRPKQSISRIGQGSPASNHESFDKTQSSPHGPTQASPNATADNRHEKLFSNIPPSVRGIVLISVNDIPESYRSMFPFPLFNAIQSKSFHSVYNSNDNIVIAAPTGSGKTVIMELAICRLLNTLKDERFKVVYQAPTKSLCSERFRDWHSKFINLNLKCAELTGDTDHMQLRSVQSSQIIITTPEKWDSMTRKWKDHMKLMQLVKLFLIDEVHILKETRGATLEAVVSRMKNIGSNVRFVALSATVPNSEDIATWLGKDATNQHVPAHREHFGEEFRPVTLKKVVYGYPSNLNDFAFDKVCGSKLPEVIGLHSAQKPTMIFCCTRNSSLTTAKELARLWTSTNPPARLWKGPRKRFDANNDDLKTTLATGVAFHHAGLGPADRHTVETGFKEGHINVICCTSTLAVGVNLPCHLVIIKNTVTWQEGGCKEYSDLEMMQMLGRAGRPQFDDSATAVILTKKERVQHYERLVQGSERLESCLHLNLIDHLNAEIGLGNVCDVESAVKWLAGTFLFVRLRRNPTHYNLKEGANQEDEDELLRRICEKDINLLRECKLVETECLRSTQFGDAMARYYIRFETMKVLLSLKPRATLSETLNAISQASEFHEIRLKANEKALYREINRDSGIRFPLNVDVALPAHKLSLLLQSELGAIEYPDSEGLQKHKFAFNQDKALVFAHVNRLAKCLIDCQIARADSIGTLNALELARSFGARVWDHSPLQMKQIDQIGVVAVRKLAAAGITSIEDLECAEAHQIEVVLSKNPPFGAKLLARLKEFPRLRVAVRMSKKEVKIDCVHIQFKVEVAFMNDKTPAIFQRRPVFVCCLVERSDGHMIDFRRTSATKIQDFLEIDLNAQITDSSQHIICHAMCDEIAGTSRRAELVPSLPPHFFAPVRKKGSSSRHKSEQADSFLASSVSNAHARDTREQNRPTHGFTAINKPKHAEVAQLHIPITASKNPSFQRDFDNFEGDDLQLDDFLTSRDRCNNSTDSARRKVSQLDDTDWLSIATDSPSPPKPTPSARAFRAKREDVWTTELGERDGGEYEPTRLANGKWACNHKCKDKTGCKHFCCREGLDKPPPKPKMRTIPKSQKEDGLSQLKIPTNIRKLSPISSGKGNTIVKQQTTDSQKPGNFLKAKSSTPRPRSGPSTQKRPVLAEKNRNIDIARNTQRKTPKPLSSDYGDDSFDDLPPPSQLLRNTDSALMKVRSPARDFQAKISDEAASGSKDGPSEKTSSSISSMKLYQKKERKPTVPKEHEIIEISDDETPEPTGDPITEPEVSVTEQSTLQNSLSGQSHCSKRKTSQDDNQSTKRCKLNPFDPASQVRPPQLPKSKESSLDLETAQAPVLRSWLDLNAECLLDDIDMVEQFKNIVDFI